MPGHMRKIGFGFLILASAAVSSIGSARAHDWYPQECCDDMDCAVVTELKYLSGGTLKVTTSRGTVEVSREFPVRPSPDKNAHACLAYGEDDLPDGGWRLMCLFLPAGAELTPSPLTPGPARSQIAGITQRKKSQSAGADDLEALSLTLLAWITAKTGLAAPQPPRITFVPKNQLRHVFDAAAYPDRQPQADVPADQDTSDAPLAFYVGTTATVYLPETWRPGVLRDQSILLHELVHHVQRFNKVVTACPAARERQAYELQATWLRERGIAEPYELIGTDEFTVLVLSACMPPDS